MRQSPTLFATLAPPGPAIQAALIPDHVVRDGGNTGRAAQVQPIRRRAACTRATRRQAAWHDVAQRLDSPAAGTSLRAGGGAS